MLENNAGSQHLARPVTAALHLHHLPMHSAECCDDSLVANFTRASFARDVSQPQASGIEVDKALQISAVCAVVFNMRCMTGITQISTPKRYDDLYVHTLNSSFVNDLWLARIDE